MTVLAEIHAGEAMQGVTLRVRIHGLQGVWVRARLGCCILRLAARVIGCKLVIELE